MTPHKRSLALCICGDSRCSIPYGECHCGCGEHTTISTYNHIAFGYVKGMPRKWVVGHQNRIHLPIEDAVPFKIHGFYCRVIPLTRGAIVIVLEEHYRWLMRWKWHAVWNPKYGGFYAVRNSTTVNGKRTIISMHKVIMGENPFDLPKRDHIDGNTLLNIPFNLRPATHTQNCTNARTRRDNTSGRKGVYERKDNGKFRVMISFEGTDLRLGQYDTFEEACAVRAAAEEKYHGEYRRKK